MRLKLMRWFLAGLLIAFSFSAQAKAYKLMVFGDSLSAGYGLNRADSFAAQLEKALKEKGFSDVKIINDSHAGETTVGGIKRLKNAIGQKPDGVVLELGINDVIKGFSVEKIEQNLITLIQGFQKNHIAVFLAGMKAPPITEEKYANDFFNMYASLAKRFQLSYYPFFMKGLFEAAGNQYAAAAPYLLNDKVHPNREGVSLIVQDILPFITAFLYRQNITPQIK